MDDKIKDILKDIIRHGDSEASDVNAAVKSLMEIEQREREDKLRHELFGID